MPTTRSCRSTRGTPLYQTMRPSVAIPQASLRAAGSSGFGFHPALANVQRLYGLSRVATVFNVGTLVRPTTRDTLNGSSLPRNLYSHSDQTQQWQSSDPNGGGDWLGRSCQRRHRLDEHRHTASRDHGERRQRAVPVGAGDQGRELLQRRLVRTAAVRQRGGDERAPGVAAAHSHLRQRAADW